MMLGSRTLSDWSLKRAVTAGKLIFVDVDFSFSKSRFEKTEFFRNIINFYDKFHECKEFKNRFVE